MPLLSRSRDPAAIGTYSNVTALPPLSSQYVDSTARSTVRQRRSRYLQRALAACIGWPRQPTISGSNMTKFVKIARGCPAVRLLIVTRRCWQIARLSTCSVGCSPRQLRHSEVATA